MRACKFKDEAGWEEKGEEAEDQLKSQLTTMAVLAIHPLIPPIPQILFTGKQRRLAAGWHQNLVLSQSIPDGKWRAISHAHVHCILPHRQRCLLLRALLPLRVRSHFNASAFDFDLFLQG